MIFNRVNIKVKLLIMLLFVAASLSAQEAEDSENESSDDQEEVYDSKSNSNDMNQDRFKSDLNDIQSNERPDYSRDFSIRDRHQLNLFDKSKDFSGYQYNKVEVIRNEQTGSSEVISGAGSSWQQTNEEPKTNVNTTKPSVQNPYAINPGLKAPRNMDAVPDNGDDPSDIPLDGGILILGLTAAAFGMKKKVNGLINIQ